MELYIENKEEEVTKVRFFRMGTDNLFKFGDEFTKMDKEGNSFAVGLGPLTKPGLYLVDNFEDFEYIRDNMYILLIENIDSTVVPLERMEKVKLEADTLNYSVSTTGGGFTGLPIFYKLTMKQTKLASLITDESYLDIRVNNAVVKKVYGLEILDYFNQDSTNTYLSCIAIFNNFKDTYGCKLYLDSEHSYDISDVRVSVLSTS